ncbi:MAG: beta-galactosidase trimerization domain-containing protein, partial [Lachnospiraceae bacterium]|nr:beta-galactosidase trimerization domain-containing protein [Lachnospiraceae bacterium]
GEEIAFGGDSIRVLKDKPYMVLETEAQAFKSTVPFPGQLKLQAVSHLASGACGVNYWHWSSIHNACESYWKGILSHDLLKNRIYEEVSEIGQAFKKVSPEIFGLSKENRTALVISHTAKSAIEWFPLAAGRSYNDVVMEYFRALYRQNIECDVVEAEALKERIDRYRMVVTPVLYAVGEEVTECLRGFVQNGGILVSSMRSFVCDENIKIYHEALPYHLTDVFGMTYQEHTAPENVMLAGKPVRNVAELLITDKADSLYRYEHPYWNQYSGVTENAFGEGRAFYIGCDVPFDLLSDLIRMAADAAGIVPVWKESFPVIIREGVSADEKKVTFLLNYSGEKKKVLWRGDAARELMTGRTVESGEEILLLEWGCQIWKAR